MQRRNVKFILKVSTITFFIAVIAGYSYIKAENLVNGPRLSITLPQNGISTSSPTIDINGKAENIVAISLNDRPIFIDEHGVFKETFALSHGYNPIKLSARDKFGRETQKILEIMYRSNI